MPDLPNPLTTEESLLHGIAVRLDRLIELAESQGSKAVKAKAEPARERQPAPAGPAKATKKASTSKAAATKRPARKRT